MIKKKKKLQIKLEIYKGILDCIPCPSINPFETDNNSNVNISSFEENLEEKIKEIKIQLKTYKKAEKEIKNERYRRNKTNNRIKNKKRKI